SQGALLPLRVTLRDFAASLPKDTKTASADRLWAFIKAELGKYQLTDYARHLLEALRRGQCIVLLDGLDEIPSKARRQLVRDAVAAFTDAYPLNRFVVTCRTLSYSERAWQLDDFPTAQLAPLDSEQIDMFINAWYRTLVQQGRLAPETAEAKSVELSSAARYMNDLAQNPMLLTTMALVHTFLGTLPYERARLYDECVKLLMWRWPQTKYVASGEWEPGIANQLGTRDERLIKALHKLAWNAHDRQGQRVGAADMPEKEVLNVLKSFLKDSWGKAETFCEYIEERTGLLVGRGIRKLTNEEGEEVEETVYAFPHRTIQEFLAGCYLAPRYIGSVGHSREAIGTSISK
ncbi:MAG: hypothetical protein IH991_11305, partial [Planctomycetes bacterium]|nr:hypothetical protein [Planctomycetota bacterium]